MRKAGLIEVKRYRLPHNNKQENDSPTLGHPWTSPKKLLLHPQKAFRRHLVGAILALLRELSHKDILVPIYKQVMTEPDAESPLYSPQLFLTSMPLSMTSLPFLCTMQQVVFVSMDFSLSQDSHTYNLTMLDEKKLFSLCLLYPPGLWLHFLFPRWFYQTENKR